MRSGAGVADSVVNRNIFEAFPNYYRLAYSHNRYAIRFLEQFFADDDHLIPYDLVVLDTQLTGLDGLQTLRKIREWENRNLIAIHGQEAKVIVLTSLEENDDLFDSFRQGCEWYVTQPITQKALEESLSVVGIKLNSRSSH